MRFPVKLEVAKYDGKKMYFIPQIVKSKTLYELDTIDWGVRAIGNIPLACDRSNELFSNIVSYEENMIIVPSNLEHLFFYNKETGMITGKKVSTDCKDISIITTILVDSSLYMFDAKKTSVYRYDLLNDRLIENRKWVSNVDKLVFNKGDIFFRKQVAVIDNTITIPFCNANAVLVIDHNSFECNVIKIGSDDNAYSGIISDGDGYWMSPRLENMYAVYCDKQYQVHEKVQFKYNNSYYRGYGLAGKSGRIYMFGAGEIESEGNDSFKLMRNKAILDSGDLLIYFDVYDGKVFCEDEKGIVHDQSINIDVSIGDIKPIYEDKVIEETPEVGLGTLLGLLGE